ncbi:MAG: acetyl-CoA carboxylase biotin carboxyl carrier protein [Christensenellales bacterium]|jgi:acetyl-CoA carboxylase biotin carboxyl carrier protein
MDIKAIQELIAAVEASSLSRLHYEDKAIKITLEKSAGVVSAVSAPAPAASDSQQPDEPANAEQSTGTVVTAPIVGTVYRAREPGQKPIVSVGDAVKQGDPLCLIEAMKLFSEVTSPCAGIVTEIHFTDGELVEFGKPLMTIGAQK